MKTFYARVTIVNNVVNEYSELEINNSNNLPVKIVIAARATKP